MGSPRHRLSEIDLTTRTATCAVCGPAVGVKVRPSTQKVSCRELEREHLRAYRVRHPGRRYKAEKERRQRIRTRLVANLKDIDKCNVCGTTENLTIDHDHSCCPGAVIESCGECVRGVLCRNCNAAEGLLKSDPSLVRALADYIERTSIDTR